MRNGWASIGKIRLEFGKASPLMKTVVAATIGLSTAALISLRLAQWDAQQTTQELRRRAAELEAKNQQLQERIDDLGSVESVRQIAAEELGLVDPDTIVFIDSE